MLLQVRTQAQEHPPKPLNLLNHQKPKTKQMSPSLALPLMIPWVTLAWHQPMGKKLSKTRSQSDFVWMKKKSERKRELERGHFQHVSASTPVSAASGRDGPQAHITFRFSTSVLSVEAPPSLRPAKKYCDVTGLVAPYTDPKTGLRYHSAEVYEIIKTFGPGVDQAYLALRGKVNTLV